MTLQQLKAKLIQTTGTDIAQVFFDFKDYLNETRTKTYPAIVWVIDNVKFKKDIRLVPSQPAKTLTLNLYAVASYIDTQDKYTVWDDLEADLDAYLRLVDSFGTLSVEKQDSIEGEYFPENLASADRELGIGYKVTLKMYDCPLAPDAPVATVATNVTGTSMTANWNAAARATKYYLDVSTSATFATYVTGYQNKEVGNVLNYLVTGLTAGTTYYYRVRAYNSNGTSVSSNVITINVHIPANDWYLPAKDELLTMREELHLHGIGSFVADKYWSSSDYFDFGGVRAFWVDFDSVNVLPGPKVSTLCYVRACRSFTSLTNYNLRDIGPTGGYIFWKSGNDYLEAAPVDQSTGSIWSNIPDYLNNPSDIGNGQENTTKIINQVGHTTSAAKLCNDLIL